MKKVLPLLAVLVISNLLTAIGVRAYVLDGEVAKRRALLNELDRFYYGFCAEAHYSGMANLPSYERLCGD